jgi:histidinol-phosphate aminotransferase
MNQFEKLLRENILNLVPYSSARTEYSRWDARYFDANENPYNRPYNRYPDPLQVKLKEKLSAIKGVKPEQIFTGNGSDEVIDLLIRAFCVPGKDNIIMPEPSYGMYEVCARVNDINIKKALLKSDFNLDTQVILDLVNEKTKLIFICSPNNPTGNSYAESDILMIFQNFHGIVILDEAYIDFAPHNGFLKYLQEYPNLVILQTFSKAWGMAGIRLGFAFGDNRLINILNRIKYPYNVSILTQNAALDMLERKNEMEMWIRSIINQRRFLEENLGQFRFVQKVYPSDANFLLMKVDDPVELYNYLESSKLIIRNRSKMPLCNGCLRVTVGSEIENKILIDKMLTYQNEINTSGI